MLYSLVATCKRHDVDPEAWFTDVLTRIMTTPVSQLAQFLPDRWKAAGNDIRLIQPAQQRPPPQLPAG